MKTDEAMKQFSTGIGALSKTISTTFADISREMYKSLTGLSALADANAQIERQWEHDLDQAQGYVTSEKVITFSANNMMDYGSAHALLLRAYMSDKGYDWMPDPLVWGKE